jgi:phage baseplate assembly protein W
MTRHGSTLLFPVQADSRGAFAATGDRRRIVEQSIFSILSTRQGERVMLPDYGVPDFVFETMGPGLAARVAFHLREQILKYEPLVDDVSVRAGWVKGGGFQPGLTADEQLAAVEVSYTEGGSRAVNTLVFPLWQLSETVRR